MWLSVYHLTYQYTILERGVDFSPDKKSFVAIHVLATNVHETSLQLRLYTRESRDPRHRGLSVSNGEVRTLGTTKFFELLDALVASLQPRETLHQSSDLAALLQQFAFHSLMIFVFSQLFRSRRTLSRSTCTWLVHTLQHRDISRIS